MSLHPVFNVQVSIGNPEKMEPITNVSHIPSNRWALICCLCKEKRGACIQVQTHTHTHTHTHTQTHTHLMRHEKQSVTASSNSDAAV